MSGLTWFKIHIPDFLKETRRLSLAARGAYMLLLCDYYENGPIPNSSEAIENIVGGAEVESIWQELIAVNLFNIDTDEQTWHHARADKDIADRAKLTERSVANGQKGGRKPRPQSTADILEQMRREKGALKSEPAAQVAEGMLNKLATEGEVFVRTTVNPKVFDETHDDEDEPEDLTTVQRVETSQTYIGAPPVAVPEPTEPVDDVDDDGDDLPTAAEFGPIPPDFALDSQEVQRCRQAGASFEEVAKWFDEWKNGHLDRGTQSANWLEAWQARFKGKMEAKPPKAKPRVEVSRKA